jgi:phosphate uptake regulator
MEYRETSFISHSHLLRMARLSQRTVDYAIKAYELKSIEACRLVHQAQHDLCELQLRFGDQGSTLNVANDFFDENAPPACFALRLYGALLVTVTAATEIAQNTLLILESDRESESSISSYKEVENFINGLVRLYTVALFNREIQHSRAILNALSGHLWLASTLDLDQIVIARRAGSVARFELSIVRCLGQIAEQACEIADVITMWLGGQDCPEIARWAA